MLMSCYNSLDPLLIISFEDKLMQYFHYKLCNSTIYII